MKCCTFWHGTCRNPFIPPNTRFFQTADDEHLTFASYDCGMSQVIQSRAFRENAFLRQNTLHMSNQLRHEVRLLGSKTPSSL
ncbi:MAG: hypothetical protein K0Q55_396 [Verrucomicrobia bacterium]|nr:hypothetical protein [Verrucomicrobiota bacterium]